MPNEKYRKPGRPKGASTKADTVGRKRARRYFDLTLVDRLRPTAAAKLVADEFETTIPDVFKAIKRHEPNLAIEVLAEAAEIERQTAEMKAVLDMGPHPLRGVAWCLHALREEMKSWLK